jgi:hypothetical protein
MQGDSMHDDARCQDDAKKKRTNNSNIGDFFFPGRYIKEKQEDQEERGQVKKMKVIDLMT